MLHNSVDQFESSSKLISSNPAVALIQLIDRKQYSPMNTVLVEHVLQQPVSINAKVYFLLLEALSKVEGNTLVRSMDVWSKLLGISGKSIDKAQRELEQLGVIKVTRAVCNGRHQKNEITLIVREDVYKKLQRSEKNKTLQVLNQEPQTDIERKKSLDAQKLFFKLNLKLLLTLLSDKTLSSLEKLFWVHLYKGCYCAYQDNLGEGKFSIYTEQKHLREALNVSRASVSRTLKSLAEKGYLTTNNFSVRDEKDQSNRNDKYLQFCEVTFPGKKLSVLMLQVDRHNLAPMSESQKILYLDGRPAERTNEAPVSELTNHVSDFQNINNKKYITKNISKNFSEAQDIPVVDNSSLGSASESFVEETRDEEVEVDWKEVDTTVNTLQKDINTLQAASFGPYEAKKQAVNRLSMSERKCLHNALSAIQAMVENKKAPGITKKDAVKAVAQRLNSAQQFVLLESLQPSSKQVLFKQTRKVAPIQLPIGKSIDAKPFKPLSVHDISKDKGLVNKAKYWSPKIKGKGYAALLTTAEKTLQIVFYASRFQATSHHVDCPTSFAVYLACKKMREGSWEMPYGLMLAKENHWLAYKTNQGEISNREGV